MYSGVPTTHAGARSQRGDVLDVRQLGDAEVEQLDQLALAAHRDRNTLSGLRSRWMMPFSCAASSASQIWIEDVDDVGERQRAALRQARSCSVSPVQPLHDEVAAPVGQACRS